jgi:hypothetical protein
MVVAALEVGKEGVAKHDVRFVVARVTITRQRSVIPSQRNVAASCLFPRWIQECLSAIGNIDMLPLWLYIECTRPQKGAQGLASQVWRTTARQDHSDAWTRLDGSCGSASDGGPVCVGRWPQLRCADRGGGGEARSEASGPCRTGECRPPAGEPTPEIARGIRP